MKELVKACIRKLPFGVGESVVFPAVIAALNFKPWQIWQRRRVPAKEARNIQRVMAGGRRRFILVFDDMASALAFGEFVHFLMVGRYLTAHGHVVKIYVISSSGGGEYFAQYLDSPPVKAFLCERLDLARAVLDPALTSVTCVSWEEYLRETENCSGKGAHIVFRKHVRRRESIYNHCFNLLNILLRNSTREFQERMLLWDSPVSEQKKDILPYDLCGGYIALACRYNKDWRAASNLTEEEFCNIVKMLKAKFPRKAVLVVSDSAGCAHFQQVTVKHGLSCSFSNDISPGFLGSVKLVLRSALFVQLNGGGIATAGIYSRVPYYINGVPANELMYSKEKIACWATGEQFFINSLHLSTKRLEMFLQQLGRSD